MNDNVSGGKDDGFIGSMVLYLRNPDPVDVFFMYTWMLRPSAFAAVTSSA